MAKGGKGAKGKGKDKDKANVEVEAAVEDILLEKPEPPKLDIEEPCIYQCAKDTITYRPNTYPGLLEHPMPLAIVGSETGTYESLCKLVHSAFRCADRIYVMVPWGNYVIFRWNNDTKMNYYVFDGCTCNVNHFRYMDLTCGTAGLLFLEELHKVLNYIIMSRERRLGIKALKPSIVDQVTTELYGDQHI